MIMGLASSKPIVKGSAYVDQRSAGGILVKDGYKVHLAPSMIIKKDTRLGFFLKCSNNFACSELSILNLSSMQSQCVSSLYLSSIYLYICFTCRKVLYYISHTSWWCI